MHLVVDALGMPVLFAGVWYVHATMFKLILRYYAKYVNVKTN